MPKRRLTEQQKNRIRANRTNHNPELGCAGQIQHEGLVVARFSEHATIEFSTEHGVNRGNCYLRANLQVSPSSESMSTFKKDHPEGLVAGDKVLWQELQQPNQDNDTSEFLGVITEVLPRQSVLLRPDNRGKIRLVAANVEYIAILIAPVPEPHFNLVDRYIVAAESQNIHPILLFNKCDLLSSGQKNNLDKKLALYRNLGYQSFIVSAHQNTGIEALTEFSQGKTGIFVGQSGVGKSSLLKRICPDFNDEIGMLSTAKSGKTKGKHTTTTSRLYHIPGGGTVIDSPGIREFGLWHLSPDVVIHGFKEIAKAASLCRFRDCKHQSEPGCEVLTEIEKGTIRPERLESYHHILTSLGQS